jgi:hypothetical protein
VILTENAEAIIERKLDGYLNSEPLAGSYVPIERIDPGYTVIAGIIFLAL